MPYDQEPARAMLRAAAYRAMRAWALTVLGEAQRDTPIEDGDLRASGTIIERAGLAAEAVPSGALDVGRGASLPPSVGGGPLGREPGTWSELGIAFIKVYAAYQHEGHRADGTYIIRHHPRGGKTHYLEDPFKSYSRLLPAMIKAEQDKALAA